MTDSHVTDLNYGHVGLAIYDPEAKEWSFTRRPGSRRTLQPVGEAEVVLPAALGNSPQPDGLARQLQRENALVLRVNPELHAAGQLLTDHARISKAVTSITAKYDPVRGALVDFGRAADVDNQHSKGTVQVAAIPGGKGGQALRLIQLRKEQRGWGHDKSVWLTVPNLGTGETGWWSGNGAPIQQVCFAGTSDDRSTFLAVRTDTAVYILRPNYHRTPVPASGSTNSHERLPSSRLEASQIIYLPLANDQPSYADVAFNPWYQRQFATVDQQGNWAVWDIEGSKKHKARYRALQAKAGQILDDEEEDAGEPDTDNPASKFHDGWFRVLWVCNVNTIAVFNRKQVALFDLRGDVQQLKSPALGLDKSVNWVLDAKTDPRNVDRMFVLTSSSLILIGVQLSGEKSSAVGATSDDGARSLLSWRHFRDTEDTTLQMSVLAEEKETFVFVRSQRDTEVVIFRFPRHPNTATLPSTGDPILLKLDAAHRIGDTWRPSIGIHIQPLGWGENERFAKTGPGQDYLNRGIRFYRAISVSDDMEIKQRLLCAYNPVDDPADRPWKALPPVEVPTWTKTTIPKSSAWVADSQFIIQDEWDDSEDDIDLLPWSKSRSRGRRKARLKVLDDREDDEPLDPWTVDNTRIPFHLQGDHDTDRQDVSTIVSGFAEKLATGLDIDNSEEHHFDTLHHLVSSQIDVSDIDTVSHSFSQLLDSNTREDPAEEPFLVVLPVAAPPKLGFPGSQDDAAWMSAIYESIIVTWLSIVPSDTPNRFRLANERQARRLAAELALASVSLAIKLPQPAQEAGDEQDYESQLIQGAEFALPTRQLKGKEKASQDTASSAGSHYIPSSQLMSSQIPPSGSLPTPSATPSFTSASSMITDLSSTDNLGAANRLKQYTTFTKPQFNPTRQINRLLSHWNVGGDPSLYDFSATTDALASVVNPDDEDMTEKERRRLEKKRLRHLKKQREEAAAAARAQALATQASQLSFQAQSQPQPFSSPGPPALAGMPGHSSQFAGMSSQVDPGGAFPASQVERGRFGGQPPRKKKKRTIGF